MLPNLDRLKVFFHVFVRESIVGASNDLNVSQSAVSQAVQKLEREVGTPLFVRMHKKLVPTSAGRGLYKLVKPFMEELDQYLRSQAVAKEHPAGRLNVGSPPEFGKAYLPAIVADFRERHRDVTFFLEFGTPETLLPLIREGLLDFALVDVFLTQSTHIGNLDIYHFTPVVEEEVILACSREYYDRCIKCDHSFPCLAKQDFVSFRKDLQTIKQWFKHHFAKYTVNVRDVLTVDNFEAVVSAIKHHVGVGVVASHLVKEELRSGRIVHIKTSRPEIMNAISLVYLQEKIPTFTERFFERYLVDKIWSMTSPGNDGRRVLHRK